jgi:hypothetical protein
MALLPRSSFLPGLEQSLDVPALLRRKRDAGEHATELRRIVVGDRSLQVLARRHRLLQLAS